MSAMLQVTHFANGGANSPDVGARVTINPYLLQATFCSDIEIDGTKYKRVTIMFNEGSMIDLNVSSFDAMAIEDAVGLVPAF